MRGCWVWTPRKPIENIVLTSPNNGRWEHVETGRWWRVGFERTGRQLDVYFQFYAAGNTPRKSCTPTERNKRLSFAVPDRAAAELPVAWIRPCRVATFSGRPTRVLVTSWRPA